MPETNPEVSVVIPTYNRSRLLSHSIQSVLNQTFTNFELLVIDDASPDDTDKVVAAFKDPRIVYIRNPNNSGGPALPMSIGAKSAKGKFVAFIDHDDQALPNWLEDLRRPLVQDDSIGMTWGQNSILDSKGVVKSVAFRNPFGSNVQKKMPVLLSWTPGTSGLMVRKSVFDEIGHFDPNTWHMADYDFTLRFTVSSKFEIAYVPNLVMNYYIHESNLSRASLPKQITAFKYFIEKNQKTFANIPLIYAKQTYRIAWLYNENGNRNEAIKEISKAILLDPKNRRYKIFKVLIALHCFHWVRPLSKLRQWFGFKYRLIRSRWKSQWI